MSFFISLFVHLLNTAWHSKLLKCVLLEEIIAYVYMHTDIPTKLWNGSIKKKKKKLM